MIFYLLLLLLSKLLISKKSNKLERFLYFNKKIKTLNSYINYLYNKIL